MPPVKRRPASAIPEASPAPAQQPKRAPSKGKVVQVQIKGRMADLMRGDIDVKEMTNEELARMQFANKNGTFAGRPPNNIPRDLVNRMRAELHARLHEKMDINLDTAIETLTMIAANPLSKDADRIKAATLIIERRMGKVPEKMELSNGDSPFEINMAGLLRRAKERESGVKHDE